MPRRTAIWRPARGSAAHGGQRAPEVAHKADAASLCLLGLNRWTFQRPGAALPPEIAQCLNGGYGWLQVKCRRCETYDSIPLEHIRRPPDTPIWKLIRGGAQMSFMPAGAYVISFVDFLGRPR
jgi:hypothetical protein